MLPRETILNWWACPISLLMVIIIFIMFLPNIHKAFFLLKGLEMCPVFALPTFLLLFKIFWISFHFVLICVHGKCDCEGDAIVFSQVYEVTLHHWDEVLLSSSYGRAKALIYENVAHFSMWKTGCWKILNVARKFPVHLLLLIFSIKFVSRSC